MGRVGKMEHSGFGAMFYLRPQTIKVPVWSCMVYYVVLSDGTPDDNSS